MKTVNHQRGVRAVRFDGANVRFTHITASGLVLIFLEITQLGFEELVYALPAFAKAYPDDLGAIQIVDQGGVLMAFLERYFIDADVLQPADTFTEISYSLISPDCRTIIKSMTAYDISKRFREPSPQAVAVLPCQRYKIQIVLLRAGTHIFLRD